MGSIEPVALSAKLATEVAVVQKAACSWTQRAERRALTSLPFVVHGIAVCTKGTPQCYSAWMPSSRIASLYRLTSEAMI